MAAYLDFTDDITIGSLSEPFTNVFRGSIDGVGFTLTSASGAVNFDGEEGYDGNSNQGCGSPLKCDQDGVGIGIRSDEIAMGQTLSLVFDTAVRINSLDFLDLYIGTGTEQATVNIDGDIFTKDAIGSSGDGGYANLSLLSLGGKVGQNILFTADSGAQFRDDGTNDYAFAGIEVSAVPIPAAAWLFGSALIGLIGFSKRKSRVAA